MVENKTIKTDTKNERRLLSEEGLNDWIPWFREESINFGKGIPVEVTIYLYRIK